MNMWGAENIEQSIRHPSNKFSLTPDGVTDMSLLPLKPTLPACPWATDMKSRTA